MGTGKDRWVWRFLKSPFSEKHHNFEAPWKVPFSGFAFIWSNSKLVLCEVLFLEHVLKVICGNYSTRKQPRVEYAAAAKSLLSCPTLCDPIDGSPPGSPIPGILRATTLEWVAISFSNVWKWKAKVKSLSCVWVLATPCTAAHQAPPTMGYSRQEYWSGVPSPSPGGGVLVRAK